QRRDPELLLPRADGVRDPASQRRPARQDGLRRHAPGAGRLTRRPMSLTLHFHPLSSFCHKVLIALYENDTPFTGQTVDLGDPESRAAFEKVWPLAKFPVLVDD